MRDYCFVPIGRQRSHNLVQWSPTSLISLAKEDLGATIDWIARSEMLPNDTIVMYGGTSGLLHGTFVGLEETAQNAEQCVAVQFSDHRPQSGDSGSVYLFQSTKFGCFIPIAIHRVFDKKLSIGGGTSLVGCFEGFCKLQDDRRLLFSITPNNLLVR